MKTRQQKVKWIVSAVVGLWAVIGVTLAGLFLSGKESGPRTLRLNDLAPAFALNDQYGHPHKLIDYRGRAVAVAFLPNLERDSVEELRSLNRAMRQFDTLGVKVFGVAPVADSEAKKLHDAENLQFPILSDTGGQLAQQYRVGVDSPSERRLSYVIGGDGRILLPVAAVQTREHGNQLVELAECCLDSKPRPASRLIGKPVADFRLPRVSDGKPESLYGDRTQKATVLFIMSAECPCSAKYDERNRELAVQYASRDVRFVAMNSSFGETPTQIAAHAQKAGYSYPVLRDAGNVQADRLEAQVTPEVFVLDAKGVLRYHGRIDDSRDPKLVTSHDLRNALDFLLAGKNPPRAEAGAFGCAIFRVPAKVTSASLSDE